MNSKHNITNLQGVNIIITDVNKLLIQSFRMNNITNIEGIKKLIIAQRLNIITPIKQ